MVYKVNRGIASFKELEYRINQDTEFKKSIGIEKKSRLFIHSKISSKNYCIFITLLSIIFIQQAMVLIADKLIHKLISKNLQNKNLEGTEKFEKPKAF